jgi:hypothetical protein
MEYQINLEAQTDHDAWIRALDLVRDAARVAVVCDLREEN